MRSRRFQRFSRGAAAALIITLSMSSSTALATGPAVALSLSVSQSPAIDGSPVTWTGTVTPVNGVPEAFMVQMTSSWFMVSLGQFFVPAGGTCEPVAICTVSASTGNATWTFASLTEPVTVKYHTLAMSGSLTRFGVVNDGTGCTGTCPATATIAVPSAAADVTYVAASQPVVAGTVLHVTVVGSATAGPMDSDLQARLSSGLAAPTNIVPSSAVFSPPPYNYIDAGGPLGDTWTLTFDTVVTAANGSTVSVVGKVWLVNAKYPTRDSSIVINVGPPPATAPPGASPPVSAPTPAPSAPAGSRPSPAEKPSPNPSASAATTDAASAMPTTDAVATSGLGPMSSSPSPNGGLEATASTTVASPSTPSDPASPRAASGFLFVAGLATVSGVAWLGWRLRVRRR